jgi:hypothetical protein
MVALTAIPCAWVAYSLSWIRQRHAALEHNFSDLELYFLIDAAGVVPPKAPGLLGLFGEHGMPCVCWGPQFPNSREELARLFPEAEVLFFDRKTYRLNLSRYPGIPLKPGCTNDLEPIRP